MFFSVPQTKKNRVFRPVKALGITVELNQVPSSKFTVDSPLATTNLNAQGRELTRRRPG